MGNLVPAACHKTSISPKIMPLCQAGLKEWKSSFLNGAFGQWQACGLNVTVLNVKLARWIAAASVIFSQPDFVAQKSHLEEYITSRGHICDFYPKLHCELNFIEQYWDAVKLHYQSSPKTADMDAMEHNVIVCLDDVLLLQIKWQV